MCEVLKVSRSGYYKWHDRPKSARQERREEWTQKVRRVYIESRRLYGVQRLPKSSIMKELRFHRRRFPA